MPLRVRSMHRLESAASLDPAVSRVYALSGWLRRRPSLMRLLQGHWLGHAVHPVLTVASLGMWTSALSLDLLGGKGSRHAAQRLVGLGVLAAVPTSLTGLAEWQSADHDSQRVAVVHAAANGTALLLYAGSWAARRSGRHRAGVLLAIAGSSSAGAGGYLGGHLSAVRKVSTRHEGFDT